MKIDFDNLDRRECHDLLVGMILPRPIAWVSTIGADGTFNLAPYSSFGLVAAKPPTLYVSAAGRQGQQKDTIRNIEYARDFVVNVVDEALAERMNRTAASYPSNVSEFKEASLTPLPGDKVMSPRIAESPVSMECKVRQIIEIGESPGGTSLVVGEIVRVHVRDALFRDGVIDVSQLKAIGRLSGDFYCRTGDTFEMKRPKYP